MFKKVVSMLLTGLLLLAISSCENELPPVQGMISMAIDGSNFLIGDYSLKACGYGRPFYTSESIVYYLGGNIRMHNMDTEVVTQLTPNDVYISDRRYLAIDKPRGKLYFAADNAIYSMNFDGNNLNRISPENQIGFSAPALSKCGNYITAIKAGHIQRMNIQTGEWIELPSPVTASYSIYYNDRDEYYFYSNTRENNSSHLHLSRFRVAEADSTLLMSVDHNIFNEAMANFQISDDCRYLGLHSSAEVTWYQSWLGYHSWYRYSSPLEIYDRQTETIISIPQCFNYAFVPGSETLLYSRQKYGMADLMRKDLPNETSTMIWDGYYSKNTYSYSVSEIYPSYDGQKVYLKAWKRPWKDEDKSSKSMLTGPC